MKSRKRQVESNSVIHEEIDGSPAEGPTPVEPLLKFKEKLNGVLVETLNDDGCNTKVISPKFLQENYDLFETMKKRVIAHHSREGSEEETSEFALNRTVVIDYHISTSNWVVAKCVYDVLLGMLWHVTTNPDVK